MGAGRYDTNKRVNTAAAAAAAARANPIVSDPVVNLPVKSVVQPAPEEFASLASPFDTGFSNSNFGGYEGLDLNLSGLDIGALREAVNPTPIQPIDPPEGRAGTPTSYYQGIQSQDYGTGPKYDNPEDALTNYADFMSEVDSQVTQTKSKYNYNQFDPGDFARAGFSGPLSVGNQAASAKVTDYITKNNIPLSKVIDGKKQYLTTGSADSYANLFGGDQFVGGKLVATGPVGTYSTTFQKDDNLFVSALNDPMIGLVSSFIPGGPLVMTAAKAAAGVKLSPIEIAGALMSGLEMAGAIKKPLAFDNGEYSGALGNIDPFVEDLGTAVADGGAGLFGTTYAQTATAINIASAGDLEGAAAGLLLGSEFGKNAVTDGLAKIGLDEKTITGAGIQLDDFRAGVDRAIREAAGGADIDEALLSGFSKYVREGGTLDIPLGGLEDVIRDIVRPIGEVGTALGQFVKDAVPDIDSSRITDALKEVGAFVEDEFTQPVGGFLSDSDTTVRQGLAEFDKKIQPFTKPVGDAIEDVGQVAGDAFSALDTAVRQALPNINLPDINLPDINLPDFNMPSFTLSNMGMMSGLRTPQLAPNRTTDSLFKDELFQFQTDIGVDLEPTEYVDLGFNDLFQDQTSLQRYPF